LCYTHGIEAGFGSFFKLVILFERSTVVMTLLVFGRACCMAEKVTPRPSRDEPDGLCGRVPCGNFKGLRLLRHWRNVQKIQIKWISEARNMGLVWKLGLAPGLSGNAPSASQDNPCRDWRTAPF
jgi:hypothetical protein